MDVIALTSLGPETLFSVCPRHVCTSRPYLAPDVEGYTVINISISKTNHIKPMNGCKLLALVLHTNG